MITLKKNADRRVRRGHLWVFSNEIADPPVAELEPGSIHELHDAAGEFLAMVYANAASLITARIMSRKRVQIDGIFLEQRIGAALERRQRLFPERDYYRLIFGEADLLPGLIVDRYGPVLAVQSLTAGMDVLLDTVLEVLVKAVAPDGIYLRNDSPSRALEGLTQDRRLAYGSVSETVTIASAGLKFIVDVVNGQKTGFFLDQEANRSLMKQYVFPEAKVLDLFCYTGAWGLHAAAAGAAQVTGVDSSRSAVNLAESNATLNGLADRFHGVRENALEFLKKSHETWDVVILDPPAFIKSRSQVKEGQKGYIDINRRALTKINPGGILVTCSCSHHLDAQNFEETLAIAARQSGKELWILDTRGQGPDHPVLLSMTETRYLKVIVAQIV
ncbi:MAG: class I SAM-dependent rRNA methyltransferase [Desulfomonilaceae bacterium]